MCSMRSVSSAARISITLVFAVAALASAFSPTSAPAALGDVIHSVPCAGPNTSDLAWVNGQLYQVIFAPTELRGIYVLDPLSGSVLNTLPHAGTSPQGLTYDGHNLWQSDIAGDAVYKLDPQTAAVRGQFPAPGGTDGQPLGLGWDGENLWLADSRIPEKIWLIDSLGTALGQIPAPGASPYGLTWAVGFVWVSDNNMSGVAPIYQLDPGDGSVVNSFPCPGGGGAPNGITHDGEYLWIADNSTDTIYQVDDGIMSGAVGDPAAPLAQRLWIETVCRVGSEISIRLSLKDAANVAARLFDLRGRAVIPVPLRPCAAGPQTVAIGTTGLASGVYFIRFEALGESCAARFVVIR